MGNEFVLIADMVSAGLVGCAMGIPQWFVWQQEFKQTDLWIGASILGWVIGPFLDVRVTWYGPIAAAITGLALVRLLKQYRANEHSVEDEERLEEIDG
jgi:hypothetical protein